ncbi:MAG: aminotransferase class III-fold pyridoxal phosphate-dependent enzyme, partial [Planctomycetes bacterium]|nr:aminotransferase class III-fold pyridoxal phosphate-dependent enzyme [Planctomycetota bacterium]
MVAVKPKWAEKGPHVSGTIPGPKAREIIARDGLAMSPSYAHVAPIAGEEGQGIYVRDVDDNVFLDLSSGMFVLNYGYSHPRLVKAVKEQAAKLAHFAGTDFYYNVQVELAEKLIALVPGDVDKRVYFGNSGTEVVE